jgi:hypothetical protein
MKLTVTADGKIMIEGEVSCYFCPNSILICSDYFYLWSCPGHKPKISRYGDHPVFIFRFHRLLIEYRLGQWQCRIVKS